MNSERFCYWLRGFAELSQERPTPEQWKSIHEHLNLVFEKVTPPALTSKKLSDIFDQPSCAPPVHIPPMPNPEPIYIPRPNPIPPYTQPTITC